MAAEIAPERDDLTALAEAVGVLRTPSTSSTGPEDLRNYRPHPAHRHQLTDNALAAMLADWAHTAADLGLDETDLPIGLTLDQPVPDHAWCDGGCGTVICGCPETYGLSPDRCEGTTFQACPHHGLFCENCRTAGCVECRIDHQDTPL